MSIDGPPQATSTHSMPRRTLPRDSSSVLPCSVVTRRASSSKCSSSSALKREHRPRAHHRRRLAPAGKGAGRGRDGQVDVAPRSTAACARSRCRAPGCGRRRNSWRSLDPPSADEIREGLDCLRHRDLLWRPPHYGCRLRTRRPPWPRNLLGHLHRPAVREPVPAVVGAADRVRQQHHAGLRRRLGRRRHQDHRPASGRQRRAARRRSSCARRPTRRTCRCRSGRARRCTRRGTGSSSPTSRSTGGCRASRGSSRRIPTASSSPRSWPARAATSELRALADAGDGLPGRGRRRARAEPVLPAHGPQGHGLEHRQGPGADLDRHRGREGGGARAGLGQAHAVDHRHRRRGARRVPRRRRRHRRRRTPFRRCRSSTPRRSSSR